MAPAQPWVIDTSADPSLENLDLSTSWQMSGQVAYGTQLDGEALLDPGDEADFISPLGFCDLGLYAYSDAEFAPGFTNFGA